MKTIQIFGITAMVLIVLAATGVHAAEALKIVVKFQYNDWLKRHPKQIGKMDFYAHSDQDEYRKFIDMSKLPKSKTIELDVAVNGKFTVHLNSYARDDGTQVSGINGPEKEPETVRLKVP